MTDRSLPAEHERQTWRLDAPAAQFVLDAISLLDHRTRARALPSGAAPPGRYLAVSGAGDRTLLIALDRPVTHVGRGLTADVRFEDPRVSRRHAIIAAGPRGMRVLDDRSLAGTFLNGRPVSVAELADGDVVRFGPVAVRYTELAPRGAAQPAAEPAPAAPRRLRPLRRIPLSRVARKRVPVAA